MYSNFLGDDSGALLPYDCVLCIVITHFIQANDSKLVKHWIKEELATEKITKLTHRKFQVVRVFRLRRVERLSHVGFLFWMPQPHGCAIIGVGHEKMHDIVDLPWQTCANKAWALGNPISIQAVNTTD